MYVHIGNNNIIQYDKIIAILNIDNLIETKELDEIYKEMKIENDIIDISEGNKKTLIIVEENKKTKAYISNISSITIAKRIENKIIK